VLRNKSASKEERLKYQELQLQHSVEHTTERQFMHERMIEARNNPEDVLMIYLDGMDQAKTQIPQSSSIDTKEKFELLGMRLIGGLTYGGTKEDQAFGFFFPGSRFLIQIATSSACAAFF
jgi:hypothetical protein